MATDELPRQEIREVAIHDPEAPVFLQHTLASTSTPKGVRARARARVIVTHRDLVHNGGMIPQAFRQDESSVVIGWLPFYHDMGLIGNVLQSLYPGVVVPDAPLDEDYVRRSATALRGVDPKFFRARERRARIRSWHGSIRREEDLPVVAKHVRRVLAQIRGRAQGGPDETKSLQLNSEDS